jgi:septal ring factor EnvC (AmiA/AmiB activator)
MNKPRPLTVALIVGPFCLVAGIMIGIALNQLAIARAGEKAEARARETEQKLNLKNAEYGDLAQQCQELRELLGARDKNHHQVKRQLGEARTQNGHLTDEVIRLRAEKEQLLKNQSTPPADARGP